jgi:DNA-binding protein HU-beta
MKLGINDLVMEISAETLDGALNQKQTKEVVQDIFAVIAENLAAGNDVAIPGFGKFRVKQSKAREGRNPKTGETLQIAARTSPAFTPAKELKLLVNNA